MTIKTFARRIGNSLTKTRKLLLDNRLPNYLYDAQIHSKLNPICLEIGCGFGDFVLHEATNNPDKIYLASDVYINGIANILWRIENENIKNILLWPNDINILLPQISRNAFSNIYILFPDPWPKKRHNKRRFLNKMRLDVLTNLLVSKGRIVFVSDCDSYTQDVSHLLQNCRLLIKDECEFINMTKYYKKAVDNNRVVNTLCYRKV